MKMPAVLFIIFLQCMQHFVASEVVPQTNFVRIEQSAAYPLISFRNSTSKIIRIGLHLESNVPLFSVSKDSSFLLDSCTLVSSGPFSPISSAGQLQLHRFMVSFINDHHGMKSLVTTPSPFSERDPISSVELSSSSLSDLPIASGFGTFLSQGLAETQVVRDSVFSNLTKHDTTEEGDVTFVRNCVMEGSIMMDSEDTFYGLVVSGLSCKTTASFHATNSTFMNCMRQDPISPELLRSRLEQNGECPSSRYPGLTTTGQSYSCSLVLDPGFGHADSYTFVTCTFTTCSTDGSGGAIYLTQSSILHSNPDGLTLRKCTFTGCIATYHGGAVFAEYVRDVEIDDTQFITCGVRTTEFTTTNYHDSDGGAVLLNYTSRNLCVKNSTFSGNTAASRGGGLYLGNIQASQSGHLVDTCKFISNTAKFNYSDKTGIAAGVGGGASMLPLQQVTVAGSLFQSNTAGWHGGGLTFSYHYVPAKGTLQWLVFKDNTQGYSGYDIYIRAPTMSASIADEYTFTDKVIAYRYEFNTSANEKTMGFNDDFLSVGPAVYKYAQSRSGNSSCRNVSTSTCYTLQGAVDAVKTGNNIFSAERVDHVKQNDYVPRTIRVYLIPSTKHVIGSEDSPDVGSAYVTFCPKGVTDKTQTQFTISAGSERAKAVFTVGDNGYVCLSYFTIIIKNTEMKKPLAEVENNANGHVRLDTMAVSSDSQSHSSSLFVIKKGEIYMKETTISTIKTNNAPLIAITPATTTAARFVSTEFSSITRETGDGAVFSVSFDDVAANTGITITGLNCKDCSAAGNGGAVSVVLTNSHDLTLSGCTFTDCSSKLFEPLEGSYRKGGAVYVSVTDTGSYIRVLSSVFSKSGASKGDYIYIDCKDGEVIGTASNWVGTINATGASSWSQAFWLDSGSDTDQRKHYAKALYYFVYTPADGKASSMIVDYSGGADIRTCGWDITNGIPCKSLTAAITQRDGIQTVKLTGYADSASNPTVGSAPFTISETLAITTLGTPANEKEAGTVPILRITDDWKTKSAIFSVTSGTTSFTNVNVKVESKLPAQSIFGKVPYQANQNYNGEIKMENVQITGLSAGTASYYFFYIQGNGTLTLKSVTVTDVTIGSYSLIGVSTQTRSTVEIDGCSFTNVKNTNGRGSVLSLSTSSYVNLTLAGTISFTGCVSGNNKFGAIYDSEALTDPGKVVKQESLITFDSNFDKLQFTDANPRIHINEPLNYLFGEGEYKDSSPQTTWRRLLGHNTYPGETNGDNSQYYWGTGSDSKADSSGFKLLHAAFTPSEAKQDTVYVAGKVDGKQQYYDVDSCGWEDVPCKTIALALAQKSDVVSLTINLKAGTHESESADESNFRNIPGSVPITIQSYGGSVIKSVESMSAALFIVLETAVVTFSGFTFTGTTGSQPLIDVKSGGSLTLTNMKFDVSEASTPLVTLTGITVDDVTDNKKKPRFAVSGTSFPQSTTEGANIKITNTDGTIFATNLNEAYESSLQQQFPIAACLEEGYNTYWVDETLATLGTTRKNQAASLLHFIHKPAAEGSPATEMHVHGTNGADIATCGWSDLPCLTFATANTNRAALLHIIEFDADYTLAAGTITVSDALVLQGARKSTQLTLGTLQFNLNAAAADLTINRVTLTASAKRGTVFTVEQGKLSFTGSIIKDLELTAPFITATTVASKEVTITFTESEFNNIKIVDQVNNAVIPSVLNMDTTHYKATLTLTNTVFTTCQSEKSTSGGAIYFSAIPDSQITVDTCTFSDCKCDTTSGKGGFLYIDCKSGFSRENKLNFKIINPYCGDCEHKTVGGKDTIISTNAAEKGSGLYIFCTEKEGSGGTNVDNILLPEMFVVNVNDTYPTSYYSFWGQAFSTGLSEDDLLKHYNIYTSTEIYVSAETVSVDESKCGSSAQWCSTLISGAGHVLPGTNSKIHLGSTTEKNTPFNGTVTLRDITVTPWTAKSNISPIPITLVATDSLTVAGSVTMETIAFTVTTPNADASFSAPTSTTLHLKGCTIKAGATITKPLFSVAGSLVLEDCSIPNAITFNQPMVSASAGSVTINGTAATKPELKVKSSCLIQCPSSDVVVTIENVKFTLTETIETSLFSLKGASSFNGVEINGDCKSYTSALITVSSGTLTLEGTTFKQMTGNVNTGMIDIGTGKLTLDKQCEFDTIKTTESKPSVFLASSGATVSVAQTTFVFPYSGTDMTNLMTIQGAAEFSECTFKHASSTLAIAGTLITISDSGTVNFTDCNIQNLASTTEANPVIKSTSSGSIILTRLTVSYSSEAQLYELVSTPNNAGSVELVDCAISAYSTTIVANVVANSGPPTVNTPLVSSRTVTLTGTSISGLTLAAGKSLISAGTSITFRALVGDPTKNCVLDNIDVASSNEADPIVFSGTASTVTITGTKFTKIGNYRLFDVAASSITTISNCKFSSELSGGAGPIIEIKESVVITACVFENMLFTTILSVTGEKSLTLSQCEIKVTSAKEIHTLASAASGTVVLSDSTVGGDAKATLKAALISATSVTAQNTTFKNIDQSSNPKSLFTTSFTITNCTFKGITQSNTGVALLKPDAGGVTISGASFIYPNTGNTWNMIYVFGGSELNKCTFKREEATGDESALDIKGTVITIAAENNNNNDVTISESSFINIHSTTQGKPVINCEASITLVIVDTTFTYLSQANLYELISTSKTLQLTSCTFGLAEGTTGKATMNTALFTVSASSNLALVNTTIGNLETYQLITTVSTATSVTLDTCTFSQVTQPAGSEASLFALTDANTVTITSCTFDSTYQTSDKVLLAAGNSATMTVTQTQFLLPAELKHSLIDVSKRVTFKECSFSNAHLTPAGSTETTTLKKPLLTTSGDTNKDVWRSELTLESCRFTYLKGDGCHPIVDLVETDPTDSTKSRQVSLIAKSCSFANVSSTLSSGQVFTSALKATFDNCEFTEKHDELAESDQQLDVCAWATSIVKVSGGTCSMLQTTFENISSGALEITGGADVSITGWTNYFKNNHPAIKGYESMNRNVMCTNSTLSISDSEIGESTSLYVVSSGCTLHDDATKPASPFFIPELTKCAPAMDGNSYLILSLEGTNLIPCSLNFQIYLTGAKSPSFTGPVAESVDVDPGMRSNAGDLTSAVTVNVSLANTPEIYGQTADRVRLEYGSNPNYTEAIALSPSITFPSEREAKGGMAEEDEETNNWLLYVIIGVSAFLFLVIVILVIYCCCCREKDERKYEEEDWDDAEDDKTRTNAALMSLATNSLIPKFEFNEFDEKKVLSVECMNTVAPYGRAVASSKNSLYSRIHSPSHRQEHNPFIWTATIAYHIAKGLLHIIDVVYNQGGKGNEEVSVDVMKKMLNTISPHSVFFGERDSILIGSVPNNYPVPVSANAKEGKAEFNLECQRYRSPEMAAHPNDESRQMKESNAVFALGFMMYEIFTGWLVFDGYPYARVVEMVASGARPDLVLVRSVDSNFASIIDAATAMDADQRLTLSQLLERIDMYLPSELRTGDAPTFVPRSMMDDDDDEDL